MPLSPSDLLPFVSLPPRSLSTPRLRLRALEEGDTQLIFDLYASDPVATKNMSFKCTGNIEDTRAYVQPAARFFQGEQSPIRHYSWVALLAATGEPIGSVGYGPKNDFTLCGGYILNRRYWGQGFASEAWKCIVDWATSQPGVYRIEATHGLQNQASGKVMKRAGMSFEGILKRHTILPNVSSTPVDVALYAWSREN